MEDKLEEESPQEVWSACCKGFLVRREGGRGPGEMRGAVGLWRGGGDVVVWDSVGCGLGGRECGNRGGVGGRGGGGSEDDCVSVVGRRVVRGREKMGVYLYIYVYKVWWTVPGALVRFTKVNSTLEGTGCFCGSSRGWDAEKGTVW